MRAVTGDIAIMTMPFGARVSPATSRLSPRPWPEATGAESSCGKTTMPVNIATPTGIEIRFGSRTARWTLRRRSTSGSRTRSS